SLIQGRALLNGLKQTEHPLVFWSHQKSRLAICQNLLLAEIVQQLNIMAKPQGCKSGSGIGPPES
ncbi:MAG: hypothetical protein ACO4AU_15690, partial [bacterium]